MMCNVQSDVFVFSGVSVAMMLKNVMKNCSLVRQEYKTMLIKADTYKRGDIKIRSYTPSIESTQHTSTQHTSTQRPTPTNKHRAHRRNRAFSSTSELIVGSCGGRVGHDDFTYDFAPSFGHLDILCHSGSAQQTNPGTHTDSFEEKARDIHNQT